MDTLFIGRHIIELDTIASTNSHAMQLIRQQTAIEGTLVWSHFQTNGKGQPGNTWLSEKGLNLTFSLVLKPTFLSAEKQFYLSKITSLAVLSMLTEFLPASQYDIQIKWPNDILVNKDKIAGILIESVLRGNYVQSSVIGVGFNVNQENFEGLKKVTSLKKLRASVFDLKTVLDLFCRHFEALYLSLKQGRFEMIDKLYFRNLYRLNEPGEFRSGASVFTAKITGVEENGILTLTDESGKVLKFNFKELEFI